MGKAQKNARTKLVISSSLAALHGELDRWRAAGDSIALVPTMGGLHDGHVALVHAARAQCRRVVATIFVNPMQFNDPADLACYPSDIGRDTAMLLEAGADLLYLPTAEVMYPPGFSTTVKVGALTDCLCGTTRPGHFDGVSTVVAKLLYQAMPDAAFFGEKDYQQLLVVRRMVRDLDIPVRIECVATVREANGLALSSRNFNLSREERARAPGLYRILSEAAQALATGGPAQAALEEGREALQRAGFARIDYLELRDGETLAELDRARPPARLFVAAWLGSTRLIDNILVA
jgi:pantoate--beta-alanine ligase